MSTTTYPMPPAGEITSESLYLSRRNLLGAGLAGAALLGGAAWLLRRGLPADGGSGSSGAPEPRSAAMPPGALLPNVKRGPYATSEKLTPYKDVTTYNNFYELGLGKDEPAENASTLKTRPWSVVCEGEVAKPQTIDIDTLLKLFPLEERIYRMRC